MGKLRKMKNPIFLRKIEFYLNDLSSIIAYDSFLTFDFCSN
jgi:hypothetical protein